MKLPVMPKNLTRIGDNDTFGFDCHNRIRCFTHCCRQLELALTPYDVLRLKKSLDLHSAEFLDRYVIVEQDEDDVFPRLYLTMVDDGNESCVFVTPEGCSVYNDRPGACRAYPMGRASVRAEDNNLQEHFVLLREDHCKGFDEEFTQTPLEYGASQGLDIYNKMNDSLATILQHREIQEGKRLTDRERQFYILALYDLDTFREKLFNNTQIDDKRVSALQEKVKDDEELLLFSIGWLRKRLFTEE